ncbi:SCO family protein [bacterium]|nr:SCO family protein [bacterium]
MKFVVVCSLILISVVSWAADIDPQAMVITNQVGSRLPDVGFKDEMGNQVHLKTILNEGKPVILTPVYYGCPSLCTVVLNGLLDGLKELKDDFKGEFKIVTFSINPEETPQIAAVKKEAYVKESSFSPHDWYFLTGDDASIKSLTQALGFHYQRLGDEYVHGAGIFVVSSKGDLKRTLFGSHYRAQDLKLALIEAGAGELAHKVSSYFYRYDDLTRQYRPHGPRLLKLVGAFLLFNLAFFVWKRNKVNN